MLVVRVFVCGMVLRAGGRRDSATDELRRTLCRTPTGKRTTNGHAVAATNRAGFPINHHRIARYWESLIA